MQIAMITALRIMTTMRQAVHRCLATSGSAYLTCCKGACLKDETVHNSCTEEARRL